MKYAIISDIHSNIQAITQAFKDIDKENIDKIICLGDIVGYNAKPKECIEAIKSNPKIKFVAQGNHDIDSCDDKYRWSVSRDAYVGLRYSNSIINEEDKTWLKSLEIETLIRDKELPFRVSHYSPSFCTRCGYILNSTDAQISFKELKKLGGTNLFFFGHSHYPTYAEQTNDNIKFEIGKHLVDYPCDIKADSFYLVNPGAIGQPRGGITSYAVLDTKQRRIWIKNLEYDIKSAQKDIEDAGYSLSIAKRLDPEYDPHKAEKQAKEQRYKKF